jgi:methanogenic corrinoid protein MtbC1
VGILLVSLALRRNGWRVIYLGQNVPTDQLLQEIRRLHPDLVCLSATTREGAAGLVQVYDGIAALPAPRPRLVFGGRAFNLAPDLRDRFTGAYVSASARDLIAALR